MKYFTVAWVFLIKETKIKTGIKARTLRRLTELKDVLNNHVSGKDWNQGCCGELSSSTLKKM